MMNRLSALAFTSHAESKPMFDHDSSINTALLPLAAATSLPISGCPMLTIAC
jgi:hypothetical protein